MPSTPRGLTYPDAGAHTRLWEHFQALASSADTAIGAAGIRDAFQHVPLDAGWGGNLVWARAGDTVTLSYNLSKGSTAYSGAHIATLPLLALPMTMLPGTILLAVGQAGGVIRTMVIDSATGDVTAGETMSTNIGVWGFTSYVAAARP
jgi:hypothetical protein